MCNQIKALKVKIKSLAEESRIIRLEERRALVFGHPSKVREKYRDDGLYLSLREHRVKDVRVEQRSSLLAYAFLRGKSYNGCEPKASKPVDVGRVRQLVEKFGGMPGCKFACDAATVNDWLIAVPVGK